MYAESLRSPRCQGQSILVKETPTPVHLQYIYTNERKECLMTQITKERMASVSTDKLIIPHNFGVVSPFLKNFSTMCRNLTKYIVNTGKLCYNYYAILLT